jgi:hypothetical protein
MSSLHAKSPWAIAAIGSAFRIRKQICATVISVLAFQGLSSAAILPPNYSHGVTDVAAFPTDDGWQHVIALHAGVLTEVYFGKGTGRDDVGEVPGALASAAYEAPAFGSHRMMVVLQNDGDIVQTWFRSDGDVGSRVLGNISATIDIAAFEDQAGLDHILVLTTDGHIIELTAKSNTAAVPRILGQVPGADRIAAFQALDNHKCIILIASPNGQVQQGLYPIGGSMVISPLIERGVPLADISGFYSSDDQFRHAIIVDASGAVREFFYNLNNENGVHLVGTAVAPYRVAAYVTKDHWRHVILGGSDGHLRELAFYNGQRTDSPLGDIAPAAPAASLAGPWLESSKNSTQYKPSTAGLTFALAGTEAVRYAVSLNAGIWSSSTGLPWVPLNSPRYAQSISVDPTDASHVFAGERDGDAGSTPALGQNQVGLWESTNSGGMWNYVVNPLTLSHPTGGTTITCKSQAIPAIAATSDGGAIVATACAVLRRIGRTAMFTAIDAFWGLGPFTAVAITQTDKRQFIWARTPNVLYWLDVTANVLHQQLIPALADDSKGIQQHLILCCDDLTARGQGFGFAAYGSRASLVVLEDNPKTSPRVASLEFDAPTGTWTVDAVNVGAGTGLGGRVFIKADQADAYTQRTGQAFALLMSGAQTVFLGTPRGNPEIEGTARGVNWRPVAETHWLPGPGDHYLLSTQSNVHNDIWDAHVSQNPADAVLLIACDGGVSMSPIGNILSTPVNKSPDYGPINDGLNTQHIQSMAIVDPSYAHRSAVVTASVDNDAWWRGAAPFAANDHEWKFDDYLGDTNFIYADQKITDSVVIWRNRTTNGVVRHLADASPSKDGTENAFPTDEFRNEHRFAVMPHTNNDGTASTLYMAALTHPKEKQTETHSGECDDYFNVGPIDGTPLAISIIYTNNYQQHRKIGVNGAGDGWDLAFSAPQGGQRLWALAGRPNPTYYVYAENDDTNIPAIFVRPSGATDWSPAAGITDALFSVPYCAVNGPVFPNAYDPSVVYALTTNGVWRLSGTSFVKETALTKLVTRSGTYSITDDYEGGTSDSGDADGHELHQSQARKLATLVDVQFDASDPYRTVAASAYGSVFFMDQREGFWRDLTPFLPGPATAISSVAIAHDGVYVGIEGRSVWRITLPELGLQAAYFDDPQSNSTLAILRSSDGNPIPQTQVTVMIMSAINAASIVATVSTASDGSVPFPSGTSILSLAGRAVRLTSAANAYIAPAVQTKQIP